MRKALINGGRWLDDDAGQRLRTFIAQRPNLATVYEFRQRLRAVYERSGQSSDAMLESLRQWCREAEASGNDALAQFAERLKGYALVTTRELHCQPTTGWNESGGCRVFFGPFFCFPFPPFARSATPP